MAGVTTKSTCLFAVLFKNKMFLTDSQLSPELAEVFEQRNEAIATETLTRNLSALKKKQLEQAAKKK